jgi:hypothetical protein
MLGDKVNPLEIPVVATLNRARRPPRKRWRSGLTLAGIIPKFNPAAEHRSIISNRVKGVRMLSVLQKISSVLYFILKGDPFTIKEVTLVQKLCRDQFFDARRVLPFF